MMTENKKMTELLPVINGHFMLFKIVNNTQLQHLSGVNEFERILKLLDDVCLDYLWSDVFLILNITSLGVTTHCLIVNTNPGYPKHVQIQIY